jgi:y4mF family transcriptional regulator
MRIKNALEMGKLVRSTRKKLGVTQSQLAAASGIGVRFLRELEKGKPSCQLDKTLYVLRMLGIWLEAKEPSMRENLNE